MTIDTQHDLSAYVLALIDEHLAAMHGIRERMRPATTASPGGRRAVALESIALAEEFAASMTRALSRDPLR